MKTGMTGRLILPAVALAAILGTGAAAAPAKNAQPQTATILTEDSRGYVSVGVGVPVEIRLRSQPGTGFSWVTTKPVAGLTDMKPIKASKPMPGSAQVQRFRFVAPKRGTYRLSFSYDQPWKGGTKAARTQSFLVVAR